MTEAALRKLASSLPGVTEKPTYGGRPAWHAAGGWFAWLRQRPDALVLMTASLDAKEGKLGSEPALFFTTPHYDGHAIVLARVEALAAPQARELLREAMAARLAASAPSALRRRKPQIAAATPALAARPAVATTPTSTAKPSSAVRAKR